MCPLKPSMLTLHPRKPQPRELRLVHCQHCGKPFDVSRKAMSIRCPNCSTPHKLEDFTVKREHVGDLDTMGDIQLAEHSSMAGDLTCGHLAVRGRYDGAAEVHGPVELHPGSHTTGQIHARSITVEAGATLRAKVTITPR